MVINIVYNKKILKEYNPLNEYLFSQYMTGKGCEERLESFLKAVMEGIDDDEDFIEVIGDESVISEFLDGKDGFIDVIAINGNIIKLIIGK